jgi:hypothetical protein
LPSAAGRLVAFAGEGEAADGHAEEDKNGIHYHKC